VKLLLFDVDGTLLDSGGAGLAALREGFFDAFPSQRPREASFPSLNLAGSTDAGVARTIFAAFGMEDTADNRARFFQAYAGRLRERLTSGAHGEGRLLEGVLPLLEYLASETAHVCALLTGNTAEGARIKTEHFGVGHFFGFGAFGDDHHDRNRLGPIAMERAHAALGKRYAPEETVVIGDTVRDIACARACGATVISVTTGSQDRETLARHDPDHLLDSLADVRAFLAAVAHLPKSAKDAC